MSLANKNTIVIFTSYLYDRIIIHFDLLSHKKQQHADKARQTKGLKINAILIIQQ